MVFPRLPFALTWLLAGLAVGQTSPTPKTEPRLPGAVESAPAWMKDAPFDLPKFFAMPPAADNAAPLYLEAFAEFSGDVADCFPPDRRGPAIAASERGKRWTPVYEAFMKNRYSLPVKQVDGLLAEYQEGFRKFDLAQRRPRCVFAAGLTFDAPMSHAAAARDVGRVLAVRVLRALDRDEFDGPLADVGRIFRLSRDLRPRGAAICQIVSIALDGFAREVFVRSFLAHPKLKIEHCDRLLTLLAEHEARAVDPFVVAVEAEYVLHRVLLRVFDDRVKTVIDQAGLSVDQKLDRAGVAREFGMLRQSLSGSGDVGGVIDPKRVDDPAFILANEKFLEQRKLELVAMRRGADDYARTLIGAKPTFANRKAKLPALEKAHFKPFKDSPPDSFSLFTLVAADYPALLNACGRDTLYLNSARCLIALRRRQLTNPTAPADLVEACRSAKLPGVPLDPFSGGPLKLTTINGESVVYSVGFDGVDDRGLKDAEMGRKPAGDFLFRLPKR